MNRIAYLIVMIITALLAGAAMLLINRAIAGYLQCASAQPCAWHSGRP